MNDALVPVKPSSTLFYKNSAKKKENKKQKKYVAVSWAYRWRRQVTICAGRPLGAYGAVAMMMIERRTTITLLLRSLERRE